MLFGLTCVWPQLGGIWDHHGYAAVLASATLACSGMGRGAGRAFSHWKHFGNCLTGTMPPGTPTFVTTQRFTPSLHQHAAELVELHGTPSPMPCASRTDTYPGINFWVTLVWRSVGSLCWLCPLHRIALLELIVEVIESCKYGLMVMKKRGLSNVEAIVCIQLQFKL